MKIQFAAGTCLALAAAVAVAGPFDAFKGKVKPGMYETKMEMDMGAVPGMPPGMGKQVHSHKHCVTQEDIDRGGLSKGKDGKTGMEKCEVKNFKMSGDTATYTMVCTEPKMTADNKIVFVGDGYKMDMKMAMDHGGQMMNMTQKMEGRYLGACK